MTASGSATFGIGAVRHERSRAFTHHHQVQLNGGSFTCQNEKKWQKRKSLRRLSLVARLRSWAQSRQQNPSRRESWLQKTNPASPAVRRKLSARPQVACNPNRAARRSITRFYEIVRPRKSSTNSHQDSFRHCVAGQVRPKNGGHQKSLARRASMK